MVRWICSLGIAGLALLLSVGLTAAAIYKCTDAQGRVTFSDRKCSANPVVLKADPEPTDKPSRPAAVPFDCASGITAVVNNLHYPGLTDLNEAIRRTESDLTGYHYRSAIEQADPSGKRPDRVSKIRAEAFPASEVRGFNTGVVVNARVCK